MVHNKRVFLKCETPLKKLYPINKRLHSLFHGNSGAMLNDQTELWQCPKRFLTADMASHRFFERRLSGLLWRHLKTRAQESDAKPYYDVIFGCENSKKYQLFMRKKSIKYFYLILKISIRYRY